MRNERISLLDSYRGIAILMVIFYHFFSRWIEYYPYQNKYDFFRLGKFGVHFFFMISGFVIFYTLDNTKFFLQFWWNRFLRLIPSMFFASIITYLIFIFFDDKLLFPTSHQVINVFVSLTFIQPDLISSLTGYQFDFNYISSSYWSLWIEIQFYIFASFFYFFVSKKEYFWFFGTAILLTVFSWLLSHIYTNDYLILKVKSLMTIFNLIDALPFFCLGSAFYVLFNNRARQIRNSNLLLFVFFFFSLFLIFNSIYDSGKILLILIFLSLFYLMIYRPNKIAYLDNLVLHKVGVSSYFLYLIHENIGVLLINKNFINSNYLSVIMPLFFILVFVIISFLFTKDIEIKIIKFFRNYVKF